MDDWKLYGRKSETVNQLCRFLKHSLLTTLALLCQGYISSTFRPTFLLEKFEAFCGKWQLANSAHNWRTVHKFGAQFEANNFKWQNVNEIEWRFFHLVSFRLAHKVWWNRPLGSIYRPFGTRRKCIRVLCFVFIKRCQSLLLTKFCPTLQVHSTRSYAQPKYCFFQSTGITKT